MSNSKRALIGFCTGTNARRHTSIRTRTYYTRVCDLRVNKLYLFNIKSVMIFEYGTKEKCTVV